MKERVRTKDGVLNDERYTKKKKKESTKLIERERDRERGGR